MLRNKKTAFFTSFVILLSLTACSNTPPEPEYTKEDITGNWYSSEIGGRFCFSDDNMLSLKVDISKTMYMDENNIMHITGSDDDYSDGCNFDGTTYSFELNGVDILTMSRKISYVSAYGEYILESGIIYDELVSEYGDSGDTYSIIADDGVLDAQIRMCEYSVKSGNIITFSGNDLGFFGAGEGESSTFNFAVQNNVLTLIGADNSMLVFAKSE